MNDIWKGWWGHLNDDLTTVLMDNHPVSVCVEIDDVEDHHRVLLGRTRIVMFEESSINHVHYISLKNQKEYFQKGYLYKTMMEGTMNDIVPEIYIVRFASIVGNKNYQDLQFIHTTGGFCIMDESNYCLAVLGMEYKKE